MDCSCDIDFPVLWQAKIRKARKPHTCSECGSAIDPSEEYEDIRAFWEDEPKPKIIKYCMFCSEAWAVALSNERGACISIGELWEYLAMDRSNA